MFFIEVQLEDGDWVPLCKWKAMNGFSRTTGAPCGYRSGFAAGKVASALSKQHSLVVRTTPGSCPNTPYEDDPKSQATRH